MGFSLPLNRHNFEYIAFAIVLRSRKSPIFMQP
nr:MAG TPA: hypothetical protein [Herelleviridae sp.]DAX56257.1 MAG TPA: hypothetical protein [Caudoviricetes sp.]